MSTRFKKILVPHPQIPWEGTGDSEAGRSLWNQIGISQRSGQVQGVTLLRRDVDFKLSIHTFYSLGSADNKIMMMMMMIIMIKRIILLLILLLLLLLLLNYYFSWEPTSSEGALCDVLQIKKVHLQPLLWFNITLSYTVNGNKPYTEKTKKVNLQNSQDGHLCDRY